MSKLLSTIISGKHVKVSHIQESTLKPKLLEMGLVVGKEVCILFKAPFGDPIAIDVQGYVLSLRLDEAKLIEVKEI
jgi:Fe2+ transport system protein FeoA